MMDCTCNIDIDHDGGPDCHSEKIVKAKQGHRCYECLKDIKPGDKYEYTSGKWDGCFLVYKTCLDCRSLRNQFFSSFTYTMIWDDFDDYLGDCNAEIPEDCIAELTPVAREKVCEKIESYWEYLES